MPMPAARLTDFHICPMFNGPQPHVGGPVSLGCPTVLIGGMAAARVTTAHGGMVVTGYPTVLIGP
jgi:uncharacterized Zn-binding protein involved in type VI secretion